MKKRRKRAEKKAHAARTSDVWEYWNGKRWVWQDVARHGFFLSPMRTAKRG